MPADVSLLAAQKYYDLIVEEDGTQQGRRPSEWFWPPHGRVLRSEAEQRVRSGKAHFGALADNLSGSVNAEKTWELVSGVGLHSPSWLTLSEIEQALAHFGIARGKLGFDFRAALACLAELDGALGAERSRLVFWFDN
jgi:hypothetical protein